MSRKPISRSTRKIEIAVGLQWPTKRPSNPKFSLGEPWPTIHGLLKMAAKAARPRSRREVVIRRLKLRSGLCAKVSVVASIRDADILVFDICPTRGKIAGGKCPSNVLFEVGVAIGMGKPVVLISGGKYVADRIPSDLAGEVIATYLRPGIESKNAHRAGTGEKSIIAAVKHHLSKL
jgi:hypothetical protein